MLLPLPEILFGIVRYDNQGNLKLTVEPTEEQKKVFDTYVAELKRGEAEMLVIE